MNNNNNYNNLRVHTHETEICHNGRLGCWVRRLSVGAVVRAVVEVAVLLAALVAFAAACVMA